MAYFWEITILKYPMYWCFLCIIFEGLIGCIQYDPVNKIPNTTDFVISPEKATTEDSLTIDWLCPITDPNQWDYLEIEIQWYQNGCEVFVEDDEVFPAWRTRRDDWIEVEIHAWDGQIRSLQKKSDIVIANTPPRIQVDFFPSDPKSGEAIYVNWWLYDADGDDVDISWNWVYNDVIVPIEDLTFPSNMTKRGDRVGVKIHAFDGITIAREDFYVDVE